MPCRIEALPLAPFVPFFLMSDRELAAVGARRRVADAPGRAPCRVSVQDADAGERLVLLNHAHLTDPTLPCRASGPIFVREAAVWRERSGSRPGRPSFAHSRRTSAQE